MEPAPEVIVLAIGPAEKRPEIVEFGAAQRRQRPAFADRERIVGADPVDLDRIEFGQPLAAQQRQRDRVEERKAQIGQQHAASERAAERLQSFGEQAIHRQIGLLQIAPLSDRVEDRAGMPDEIVGDGGKILAQRGGRLVLQIERQHFEHRRARGFALGFGDRLVALPIAGQPAREQAQPADAKGQIVRAEEFHRRRACRALRPGKLQTLLIAQIIVQAGVEGRQVEA